MWVCGVQSGCNVCCVEIIEERIGITKGGFMRYPNLRTTLCFLTHILLYRIRISWAVNNHLLTDDATLSFSSLGGGIVVSSRRKKNDDYMMREMLRNPLPKLSALSLLSSSLFECTQVYAFCTYVHLQTASRRLSESPYKIRSVVYNLREKGKHWHWHCDHRLFLSVVVLCPVLTFLIYDLIFRQFFGIWVWGALNFLKK